MPREEPLCLGTAAVWSETFASLEKKKIAVSAESFMHVLVFFKQLPAKSHWSQHSLSFEPPSMNNQSHSKGGINVCFTSQLNQAMMAQNRALRNAGLRYSRRKEGLRQSADGRGKKTKENHLIKKFKSLVPKCCFKHLTKNTYRYWGKIKHMSYSILCSNIWISLKNQNIEYKENHNIVQYKQNIVTYDQSISLFFTKRSCTETNDEAGNLALTGNYINNHE